MWLYLLLGIIAMKVKYKDITILSAGLWLVNMALTKMGNIFKSYMSWKDKRLTQGIVLFGRKDGKIG